MTYFSSSHGGVFSKADIGRPEPKGLKPAGVPLSRKSRDQITVGNGSPTLIGNSKFSKTDHDRGGQREPDFGEQYTSRPTITGTRGQKGVHEKAEQHMGSLSCRPTDAIQQPMITLETRLADQPQGA
jgi:hypothetical protein